MPKSIRCRHSSAWRGDAFHPPGNQVLISRLDALAVGLGSCPALSGGAIRLSTPTPSPRARVRGNRSATVRAGARTRNAGLAGAARLRWLWWLRCHRVRQRLGVRPLELWRVRIGCADAFLLGQKTGFRRCRIHMGHCPSNTRPSRTRARIGSNIAATSASLAHARTAPLAYARVMRSKKPHQLPECGHLFVPIIHRQGESVFYADSAPPAPICKT
jgi:hypothetical protein